MSIITNIDYDNAKVVIPLMEHEKNILLIGELKTEIGVLTSANAKLQIEKHAIGRHLHFTDKIVADKEKEISDLNAKLVFERGAHGITRSANEMLQKDKEALQKDLAKMSMKNKKTAKK